MPEARTRDEMPRERQDFIPRKRKKREDVQVLGKRLAVNTVRLDFEKFNYRWINATDARLWQMTQQDDWQLVHQDGTGVRDDESADLGTLWTSVVGTTKEGQGLKAYLCRKPRQWYEDDQKQKQTDLDEQLSRMKTGLASDGTVQGADYIPGKDTPGEAIKIG